MLHQLHSFSHKEPILLACSGGSDSMAVADFYKRGNKNFELAYFNHRTEQANEMEECVRKFSQDNKVPLTVRSLDVEKDKDQSPEEFFRNERYKFLADIGSLKGRSIITCHHLNDAGETFIFNSINGNTNLIAAHKVIHYRGEEQSYGVSVYRPFLTNTKQELLNWCLRHNVSWVEDISNRDVSSPRNRIRHNILPEILKVNPGFLKVIKKKYLSNKEV